jgi:hypothetical protein
MKTIERVALPAVWAWAFLASLAVFLAHMLYQMWAPHLVRQSGLRQYALEQRNLYAENPSDGSLGRAEQYLKESSRLDRVGPRPPANTTPDVQRRWELDVVEEGAFAEYLFVAKRNIVRAWIVAFLYAIGILISRWREMPDRLQLPELRGCNCRGNVMISSSLANTTQTHADAKASP